MMETIPGLNISLTDLDIDTPLILQGSDRYNHDETIQKIIQILVYNEVNHKNLKYEKSLKPLVKGEQVSKFYPLTKDELKTCIEKSKEIILSVYRMNEEKTKTTEVQLNQGLETLQKMREEKLEREEQNNIDLLEFAGSIFYGGDFIEYCKAVFEKIWYEDEYVLEAILYQAAIARMKNPYMGVHLHFAGATQIGKTKSVYAALKIVHPSDVLNRKFSKQWMFYSKTLHERTILFADDLTMDAETAEHLRAMLTSWDEGCERGVTGVNREEIILKIPRRVSLILSSVENVSKESDDAQDESRFLTVNMRTRSPETEKAIRKFMQQPSVDISQELKTIHLIWEYFIEPEIIKVELHDTLEKEIPFREFGRYLAMIQAHALLCGRTKTSKEDMDAIDAFLQNTRPMLNSTTAGFTNNERCVLECLSTEEWMSIKEIQDKTGLTYNNVVRALRGKEGTLDNPTNGLLVKSKIQQEMSRTEKENNIRKFRKMIAGNAVQTKF